MSMTVFWGGVVTLGVAGRENWISGRLRIDRECGDCGQCGKHQRGEYTDESIRDGLHWEEELDGRRLRTIC